MQVFDVGIIGAGASGIAAAVSAAQKGYKVILLEKCSKIGRKIIASGSGRCNFLNEDLNSTFYSKEAKNLVESVFNKVSKNNLKSFFQNIGLYFYADKNRVFPFTNQSSSVLTVLEKELIRLNVSVELNFEVSKIQKQSDSFAINSKAGNKIFVKKIIICGGGKSYPALGADGSCYKLAESFGHIVNPVYVACVALESKDKVCHFLQGQKIFAQTQSLIDGVKGKCVDGELLFTKYGLSGTAILDMSEDVSYAINIQRKSEVFVLVDMVPFMELNVLVSELEKRFGQFELWKDDFFAGILPNKFSLVLKDIIFSKNPKKIASLLKNMHFKINATRGWNEAEFTYGGVDLKDINPDTLESLKQKNIYFCGEILDVKAKRGGYNLAWAWASGILAGQVK